MDCQADTLEPTAAEQRLIDAAACGDEAVIATGVDDAGEFAWQPEHEIRASVIRALALGQRWSVDPRGLRLTGARVTGVLDLQNAEVGCALELVGCSFEAAPVLVRARTRVLRFTGSHLPGLSAYGVRVDGHLGLDRGFTSVGVVDLMQATVVGDVDCGAGTFANPSGDALSADGVHVTGSVFLSNGFTATGQVRLLSATVGGVLSCTAGTFTNPDGRALNADRIQVTGSVFLRGGFTATGQVRLNSATLGGVLSCTAGTFTNPDGRALNADGIQVTGGVFLRGGFTATGEVRLLGATIGGNLECDRGTFTHPDGRALNADGFHVSGAVFLRGGFTAAGLVSMPASRIGSDLQIAGARLDASSLDLDHARVGGTFHWRNVESTGKLELDLSHFAVGQLRDDWASWEQVTGLAMTGFRYDEISERSTMTPQQRLAWVGMPKRFSPQPYEQLGRVLRESGRPAQARKVLRAKEDALRVDGDLRAPMRAWNWFLAFTVGHGYQLGRPLVAIAALLLAATVVLSLGAAQRAIVLEDAPTTTADGACPGDHPCFQPFVFALDTLLPIVDLDQDDAWRPNAGAPRWGTILQIGWWVYVLAGWTLTTAAVAGFGALLRRE